LPEYPLATFALREESFSVPNRPIAAMSITHTPNARMILNLIVCKKLSISRQLQSCAGIGLGEAQKGSADIAGSTCVYGKVLRFLQ
jgi:hypothetical protein